jgi:hypothetical protein
MFSLAAFRPHIGEAFQVPRGAEGDDFVYRAIFS